MVKPIMRYLMKHVLIFRGLWKTELRQQHNEAIHFKVYQRLVTIVAQSY